MVYTQVCFSVIVGILKTRKPMLGDICRNNHIGHCFMAIKISKQTLKILSWNMGVGCGGFKAQLKDMKMHNLDIIILMETKLNSSRTQQLIHSLHISNFIEISPRGFSGGLWLLQTNKDTFQVEVIQTCKRYSL